MRRDVQLILQRILEEALEVEAIDRERAGAARAEGRTADYYDLAIHPVVPDAYWALQAWDEAREGYATTSERMLEQRRWHLSHSGADYPHDELVDWLATTMIKAGRLGEGSTYLRIAIRHLAAEAHAELALASLGLHAAQAGIEDLADYATQATAARQQLPGGTDVAAQAARRLLNYEAAQTRLLLHQWHDFEDEVRQLEAGLAALEETTSAAFPDALQRALVSATHGFRAVAQLKGGTDEPDVSRVSAVAAFEDATLGFLEFSGLDTNTYFMRLNTRLVEDLVETGEINPNPFSTGSPT